VTNLKLGSSKLAQWVRAFAHRSRLYCELRLIQPEGISVAKSRFRRQRANLRWLRSFYHHFSGSSLPLHIHDGGMSPSQVQVRKGHFRASCFHRLSETTALRMDQFENGFESVNSQIGASSNAALV
jgi:hypothetical protein